MEPIVSEITRAKKAMEALSVSINKSLEGIDTAMASVDHIFTEYIYARKMESVGLMAGGVAHDFKNFIHVVAANADLIKKTTDNEKNIRRSEQILQICYRTSDLVDNIMTLAKTNQIERRYMELNKEIEKDVALLEATIPDNIELEISFPSDLLPILGDPAQIYQTLTNLVNNATDATADGGLITIATKMVTVRDVDCQAHANARPGEFVTLTVSDTGLGIPKDVISKIFDPFHSTKKGKNHAGFGLAIVYTIVQNHEGWIDVESEVGEGTMFTLFFPVFNETNCNEYELQRP